MGKSRSEYGEEKKISRLIADMDEFLQVAPKFLGSDILIKEERNGRPSSRMKDDEKSIAKMEFKSAILRVKETKEELEQLHKISEEEVRKRGMRRGDSMESNVDESPRGRSGIRNASQTASSQKRALYRKAVSMGDGMAENSNNIWQSKESVGSNESLASNASIPLPIPVRTRSARGGSESGYSSDTYNAMTIKRLERDTSVDRLSTGSRESNRSAMSTTSDMFGEKKKKAGLIGKLKKLTRKSEEKEFGSGSDISDVSKVSVASSAMSAFQKVQQKRGASKDRSRDKSKDRSVTNKPPEEANKPFDQYFGSGGASGSRGRAT